LDEKRLVDTVDPGDLPIDDDYVDSVWTLLKGDHDVVPISLNHPH
jgi:hypothetical protein